MNISLEFDLWHKQKKHLNKHKAHKYFRTREIVLIRAGLNVGIESNGKGDLFLRPVVIMRKISQNMAIVVPLTTKVKDNAWFQHSFIFKSKKSAAVITQLKCIDGARVFKKIGMMPIDEFNQIKLMLVQLFE